METGRLYDIKGTKILNHYGYKQLHTQCKCNKSYPSIYKEWCFNKLKKKRIKEDIKYHRYEE